MKIQRDGSTFSVKTKDNSYSFNPSEKEDSNFALYSAPKNKDKFSSGKNLSLPGEFEINGVLISSFYSDEQNNVVFKTVTEDLALVHFGNLAIIPNAEFFEKMGENVDVIILEASDDFDAKLVKNLIEKLDPRMAIIGGDNSQFAKITELTNARTETEPLEVKRSELSDERTDILILG